MTPNPAAGQLPAAAPSRCRHLSTSPRCRPRGRGLAGSASATSRSRTPRHAAASQDASAEIIDAASRLKSDPVFEAPPEEIPASKAGNSWSSSTLAGMVAAWSPVDGQRAGIWISRHPSGVRATLGAYRDYGRGAGVITRPDGARNEGSYGERGEAGAVAELFLNAPFASGSSGRRTPVGTLEPSTQGKGPGHRL